MWLPEKTDRILLQGITRRPLWAPRIYRVTKINNRTIVTENTAIKENEL